MTGMNRGVGRPKLDPVLDDIKQKLKDRVYKANARLDRLESNELTNLPAYRSWEEYSGERFSMAGTDYNELQKELGRVNRFLNSETSLVRSGNRYMKGVADNIGIQYDSISELPEKTAKFFELQSKIEQYNKTSGGGSWQGYQEVWQNINEYVEEEGIDLGALDSVDDVLEAIIEKYDYESAQQERDIDEFDWFDM